MKGIRQEPNPLADRTLNELTAMPLADVLKLSGFAKTGDTFTNGSGQIFEVLPSSLDLQERSDAQ